MSKQVTFGMYWQCYGRQTIDLPDDVDATDLEAVKEYIRSAWADVGIPVGEYVGESDEFDEESAIVVSGESRFKTLKCVQSYDEDCEEIWTAGKSYEATKASANTYEIETNQGRVGAIGEGFLLGPDEMWDYFEKPNEEVQE